jgi:vacuole morphology and inheritance protein 14
MSGVSASGMVAATQPLLPPPPEEYHLFDYQATVNELTIQFLSEHEDTRVAALKWLIMLHQKAPKDVRIL